MGVLGALGRVGAAAGAGAGAEREGLSKPSLRRRGESVVSGAARLVGLVGDWLRFGAEEGGA